MNKIAVILGLLALILVVQTGANQHHQQIKEEDPDCCKYGPQECCFAKNKKLSSIENYHLIPTQVENIRD